MTVVVATGVSASGEREILGLDVGDSEDEVFWRGFLTSLRQRGLSPDPISIWALKKIVSGQRSFLDRPAELLIG